MGGPHGEVPVVQVLFRAATRQIESAYLVLRHTLLAGHVLRSADRTGVEQEVWALLTLHQLLRTAMVEAVETRPGLDPDRASFTTALHTARDQLITAQGIDPDPATAVDRLGAIGHAGQRCDDQIRNL
jgi:hypothetical protein